VVRGLDGRPARPGQRRVGVDGGGVPGMLPFVLARQQIAADRLTDQRVPEGIPIRGGQ